jgi:hypothetical protein
VSTRPRVLTASVDRALDYLDKQQRFPPQWDAQKGRFGPGGGESVQQWLSRCAQEQLNGDIARWQIEENLGVFAAIERSGRIMTWANLQAVVVNGATLEEFVRARRGAAIYLRVDYDLKNLGEMFREPLPHIHVVPHGEPRIAFPIGRDGNLLADFFEFLYLNYFHRKWLVWAREVWSLARHSHGLDAEADPFEPIAAAFPGNQVKFLRQRRTEIQWIKDALRARKDTASPHIRIEMADRLMTSPHA